MSYSRFPQSIEDRLNDLLGRLGADLCTCGLLVALSGGPDSVALLKVAVRWAQHRQGKLVAAHLNHNLRGTHSDGDALFCQELCADLGVPLILKSEDPRALARSRGKGLEDAARHLRHGFFREILDSRNDLQAVATGHHCNDQAETLVMRLFRGTGPDGMAGIAPIQGRVLHPMLHVTRAEILAWLESENQPWRQDASNLQGDNTRSRLRRELLPVARNIFGPSADLVPSRLAELWSEDLDYLDQQAQNALKSTITPIDGELSVPDLLDLHPALMLRVLRVWLLQGGNVPADRLESVHLMNIVRWLREGTSGTGLDLPGTGRLERVFDKLRLEVQAEKAPPMRRASDFRILVATCDPLKDPAAHGKNEGFGLQSGEEAWNLTCPSHVLRGNLRVRNWRKGDRIRPLGLDGSRKLSDLFREQRLAAPERSEALVVEDDEGILWVVGWARDERTRLLQPEQPVVTIKVASRRNSSLKKQEP